MSMKESQQHKPTADSQHGTMMPYIIGFILSLIFTIIPYHLVVNKVISGNALLATILGIAVWQMIIQLVFFLHLGRGPKPLYNVVFMFATGATIIVVIGASLFIMANLYRTMTPEEFIRRQAQEENIAQIGGRETGACNELRNNHIITISGGVTDPSAINAKRCDTLTFINEDDFDHEIGFGVHPDDVSYGGLFEIVLDDGRPETITLNEVGDFVFHDHYDPNITGSFTVSP